MDPSQVVEDIERTIGIAPAALLAIVLLAGPTVAWLLYRFVVQPRTSRYADQALDLLWICEDCRSANEIRSRRCYSCGLDRDEIEGALQVVDDTEVVTIDLDDDPTTAPAPSTVPGSRPLVAVGPGRPERVGAPAGTAVDREEEWPPPPARPAG